MPMGGLCGKEVNSWPGGAGGGRFFQWLCPGLVWDVGCGQAKEEYVRFVVKVYFLRMEGTVT